jgi:hypothetical protein
MYYRRKGVLLLEIGDFLNLTESELSCSLATSIILPALLLTFSTQARGA